MKGLQTNKKILTGMKRSIKLDQSESVLKLDKKLIFRYRTISGAVNDDFVMKY